MTFSRGRLFALAAFFAIAVRPGGTPLCAQGMAGGSQMPDPKQMSGRPLPVADLPAGTVTVRVVRGSMANVIPDQPVEPLRQVLAKACPVRVRQAATRETDEINQQR